MLNLHDPLTAYCVDAVVMEFGMTVEADLDSVKMGKGKNAQDKYNRDRDRRLKKWLGIPQKFRPPK